MGKINIQKMKEIVQSSNLNFLIGSGLSTPFLPLLNDIEIRLSTEKNDAKKIEIYKEYFQKVMLPNKIVVDGSVDKSTGTDFQKTYSNYQDFFTLISLILLRRKSTILSKQGNVFTTNVDIIMETVLEARNLNYNDGFSGQLIPSFNLSNFKKSVYKRSLHFENISELPVFNLVKIHGSLTWQLDGDKIIYSKLNHFEDSILKKDGEDFRNAYKKILIVNPDNEKFEKTVVDLTYYELLRMYSAELEKENSVLFIMGFSMADKHIKTITLRSANSNPTLKIYIFCYKADELTVMKENVQFDKLKYSNIEIISPEVGVSPNEYNLEEINKTVFTNILSGIEDETQSK